MPLTSISLPSLAEQAQRLLDLGLDRAAGLSPDEIRAAADTAPAGGLLVIHPDRLPASAIAPHLRHAGQPGFVVEDMAEIDQFAPIEAATPPPSPLHVVHDVERGDSMANWSPQEALEAITERGRTPLLLTEGIHWLLQRPDALERNHCFMTIGSRLRRADGSLDARTPALWISNGTGRDGRDRKHAPKVGWCWAGNRHTWLGFASASGRSVTG